MNGVEDLLAGVGKMRLWESTHFSRRFSRSFPRFAAAGNQVQFEVSLNSFSTLANTLIIIIVLVLKGCSY
jgi:hypothetical protein